MRRLISPFQMITDHCFPLLKHTHSTSYEQVCAWHLKKESISFQAFHYSYHLILTSPAVHGDGIQLQRKERGLCFICPGNETHSHPQWPFVTTVSAADNTLPYLSVFGGEIVGQWEPVMNETSPFVWYIFLISRTNNTDIWNEYRQLKEHRQHNSLGRQEEIDNLYIRKHLLWFLTCQWMLNTYTLREVLFLCLHFRSSFWLMERY